MGFRLFGNREQDGRSGGFGRTATDKPMLVFYPKSYDDVAKIIDGLKDGKCAMVHLTSLKPETSKRILDMLSGAIYALGGGVYEAEKSVFMFSPTGLIVNR